MSKEILKKAEKDAPKKALKTYSFPAHKVSIQAYSQAEALKKLKSLNTSQDG